MMSSTTSSVSKGVFAFKQSRKKNSPLSSYSTWMIPEEGKVVDENIRSETYKNYNSAIIEINNIIMELQNKNHSQLFEALGEFVNNCRINYNNIRTDLNDIPTACLVTGVNMPDHDATFTNLVQVLSSHTPHIARLKSRECTNVRSTIIKFTSQILKCESFEEDEGEEEIVTPTNSSLKLKRSQYTMPVLSAWYKENLNLSPVKSPKKGSPRKKMKTQTHLTGTKAPIVVILEDVESFNQTVLQDFILICSEYRKKLPIILIFGVATGPAAIHSCINQETSSVLAIETFQAQPSSHYLNSIIEEVILIWHFPFHIGGRVFKLLLDIFLYNDLSVNNFISGFKYCMLQHFQNNEASIMCSDADSRCAFVESLNTRQLNVLRQLKSFRPYVEKLDKEKQIRLLTNDEAFQDEVLELVEGLENFYDDFVVLIKVVNLFTSKVPHAPLGKQVREILSIALSEQLTKTEEFQRAWKYVQLMGKEELHPILIESLILLQEFRKSVEYNHLLDKIKTYVNSLDNIGQENMEADESVVEEEPKSKVVIQASDRFNLKEKLLGTERVKKLNEYERLRKEILDILHDAFEKNILPPKSRPLHEVMFFDDISLVKRHILGIPRATITTGLSNPHMYLECDCCKLDDPSSITPTMPALSVVYKLHLECGRLINLYDWLQAFIAVVDPEESDKYMDGKGKPKIDDKLQARFVQAVSELQFLGFIKPTKRKTDHVARLTWGGC